MEETVESIAVVGIGCRFPGGADSPTTYWEMQTAGRDGIVPVPDDRWDERRFYDPKPAKPGRMYVRHGGFLRVENHQTGKTTHIAWRTTSSARASPSRSCHRAR